LRAILWGDAETAVIGVGSALPIWRPLLAWNFPGLEFSGPGVFRAWSFPGLEFSGMRMLIRAAVAARMARCGCLRMSQTAASCA
jgi:hypothetical protein